MNIEEKVLSWIGFFIVANIYFASAFLWFAAYSEATSSYSYINQFPEYAAAYRKTFYISMFFVIFYPMFYITGSIFLYINSEYFRQMILCIACEIVAGLVVVLFTWLILAIKYICPCFYKKPYVNYYDDAYAQIYEDHPNYDLNLNNQNLNSSIWLMEPINIPQRRQTLLDPLLGDQQEFAQINSHDLEMRVSYKDMIAENQILSSENYYYKGVEINGTENQKIIQMTDLKPMNSPNSI